MLADILDCNVSLKEVMITIPAFADWYIEEIREAKQERRCLERHYRASALTIDELSFTDQCYKAHDLIGTTKRHTLQHFGHWEYI